eukprot:Skav216870  [mRNA]  locus=scaffold1042:329355:332365:- [translate_table: standard]
MSGSDAEGRDDAPVPSAPPRQWKAALRRRNNGGPPWRGRWCPTATRTGEGILVGVVNDDDSSDDDGTGDFLGIVRGIQAQTRKSDSASASVPGPAKDAAPKRKAAIKRDEARLSWRSWEVAEDLERDRKETARRTLELMEAGLERGPRYVNNVAVFVKKGQKDIDANEQLDLIDPTWLNDEANMAQGDQENPCC